MSTREIEKESVSVCDWRNGALKVSGDELWQLSTVGEAQPSSAAGDHIACTNLDEHVRLRLNPMRRWSEDQFSPHCQLPVKEVNSGLVLCFQAMARESIGIALSSEPNFVKQSVYEIHLGAVGNTSTSFQRKGIKERSLNVPSRVCHDKAWIPYWVCWFGGKVYAGIGNVPSEQCIGVLDDSESPVENIRYVGFGNLARGGSNNTHTSPVHIQKVLLTTIPPSLPEKLNALPADLPVVVVQSEEADEYRKLLEDYKKECNLRRSRAEKFGTAYKEPAPEAFLPWTQAKRLRENPEKGFVTGFDLQDPEELAKQEARKARFGITNDKPVVGEGEAAEMNIAEDDSNLKTLEVVQAWDKEQMLRPQRNDPPPALWKQNTSAQSGEDQDGTNDFAMEPPKPVEQVPAKIHLFAIDWAAFKQIRNKDLMSYFSIYGPTYIEWLADLSCNICFEDKFSAARALHNLSQDIPSPAPENVQDSDKEGYEAPDLGNMGWRFCLRPIRKVSLTAMRKLDFLFLMHDLPMASPLIHQWATIGLKRQTWSTGNHSPGFDAACSIF